MLIPFIKMNAQGNDFVVLDGLEAELPKLDYPQLARHICDRHFGVGADGLVLLKPIAIADAQMIIYNIDGSRAEMCGSALRCVASLLMQKLNKENLEILTDSGTKQATRHGDLLRVNLGVPELLHKDLSVEGFRGDLVDIGNPHFVVFSQNLEDDPHLKFGALLEHHPAFHKAVNVHFVRVTNKSRMQMKIWEHACGATLACGTGAASAVRAGISRGILDTHVAVEVPGGCIFIDALADGSFLLSGEVAESFRGIYPWKT